MMPANGEYVMICSIHRVVFFFMLITFLIVKVYSFVCQKGGKKWGVRVKKLSRENAFLYNPKRVCDISSCTLLGFFCRTFH
jgi:hypothetical protein